MVAIPAGLALGFGRAWSGDEDQSDDNELPSSAPAAFSTTRSEDLQRGEMIFILRDPTLPSTDPKYERRLPVDLITSAAVDPASTEAQEPEPTHVRRQAVAFVRIPTGLVDDGQRRTMEIRVERWRRDSAGAFVLIPQTTAYEDPSVSPPITEDAVGWGTTYSGPPSQPIPITVVDDPDPDQSEDLNGRYTAIEGWFPDTVSGCSGTSAVMLKAAGFQALLDDTVPNPEFTITVNGGGAPYPPSAWETTLSFPTDRMEIVGVHLPRENPSGGLAHWEVDSPTAGPTSGECDQQFGNLTIRVIDLDQSYQAKVAFRLINEDETHLSCRTPIDETDLTIDTLTSAAYDADGDVIATATFPITIVD